MTIEKLDVITEGKVDLKGLFEADDEEIQAAAQYTKMAVDVSISMTCRSILISLSMN